MGKEQQVQLRLQDLMVRVVERFSRDFDSSLFNEQTPLEEVRHKVAAYMGEKLFKPRREDIFIGHDGSLDQEYSEVMKRSVSYWRERGDEEAAYRFEMELVGMQQLALLVSRRVKENTSEKARFIIGSDPGSTYKTQEGSKSVVFVGEVESLSHEGIVYRQYAIPLELLSLLSLYENLVKIGDVEQTKQYSNITLGELTAENLVAYPIAIVGTLNRVAEVFGKQNWDQIVEQAEEQLRLENDILAIPRRNEFINRYTSLIFNAIKRGESGEYLNTIDESMRRVFALEAGARDYLGMSPESVGVEVEKNILAVLAQKEGLLRRNADYHRIEVFENTYNISYVEVMKYYSWMIGAFNSNPNAMRALSTGCGGGLSISKDTNRYSEVVGANEYSTSTYSGSDMMQNYGYQEGTTTYTESSISSEEIVVHLEDGTTYVLKIREGWKCAGEGCGRISSNQSHVRIGECCICEFCDPNVHRGD